MTEAQSPAVDQVLNLVDGELTGVKLQAIDTAWTKLGRAYQNYQGANGGAGHRNELVVAFRAWKESVFALTTALPAPARVAVAARLAPLLVSVSNGVNRTLEAEATRDNFRPAPDGRTGAVPFLNTMAFFDRVKELKEAMDQAEVAMISLRMGV